MDDNKTKQLLNWYDEQGVNEVIDYSPQSQLQEKTIGSKNSVKKEKNITLQTPEKLYHSLEKIIHEATNLAEEATSLTELFEIIKNFEGCDLKKLANKSVVGDGMQNAEIMIIGEAPGTKEDEHGIPFCGDSGKLLDMMFETIGLARDKNIFISNTIYWRPPANRNPNFEELAICYPFMAKMIELLNPKLIILVGAVAAKNLLGYIKPMAQLRQQIIPFSHPKTNQNFPTITIYHPAFLLRQPQQKKNMWLDLQFIKKYMLEYNIKT